MRTDLVSQMESTTSQRCAGEIRKLSSADAAAPAQAHDETQSTNRQQRNRARLWNSDHRRDHLLSEDVMSGTREGNCVLEIQLAADPNRCACGKVERPFVVPSPGTTHLESGWNHGSKEPIVGRRVVHIWRGRGERKRHGYPTRRAHDHVYLVAVPGEAGVIVDAAGECERRITCGVRDDVARHARRV